MCAKNSGAFFRESVRIFVDTREKQWHIRGMKRTRKQTAAVDAVAEAKRRILETLERMPWTTGKRPPFVPADVRRQSGLPKTLFDQAAVALLREGIVYMAEHDHAGRLRQDELDELVYGGERESEYFRGIMRPVYYCSISRRERAAAA
jgi:hypothetical protein